MPRFGHHRLIIVAAVALLFLMALSPIVTPAPAARAESLRVTVSTSNDDARSFGSNGYADREAITYVGSGDGTHDNIAGFRFAELAIPTGATIDSVTFTLVSARSQWSRLLVDLAFEASDNAATFAPTQSPRNRVPAQSRVLSDTNIHRLAEQRYALGDSVSLAGALQEIVDRPGWQSGNSVVLLAIGPASPPWSRQAFVTNDAGPETAPALDITYHVPSTGPTETPTTATGSGSVTVTTLITDPNDDARSTDAPWFTANERIASVGTGNGSQVNVNGYRFTNLAVPAGATIDEVYFSLVKRGDGWSRFVVELGFQASENAPVFSTSDPPAARPRTVAMAALDTNVRWTGEQRYALGQPDQLATALQEVVNRPGWQAGNSVVLLAYGDATPPWARLQFWTADAGVEYAPELRVTYHVNQSAPGTATSAGTATSTVEPTSTSTVEPTAGSTGTATPTLTPTPLSPTVEPTRTPTPTPEPTPPATATATATPTAAQTPSPTATPSPTPPPPGETGNTTILVGAGYTDVSPKQLVRSSDDRLWVVAADCASYPNCPNNVLRIYRADQTGVPETFTAVQFAAPGDIGTVAVAIDGADNLHLLWNDRRGSGNVNYATFSTRTGTLSAITILDTSGYLDFGQGSQAVALALDASGTPHVVYLKHDGTRLRVIYRNRLNDAWSAATSVDDISYANGQRAWHPNIAADTQGRVLMAWLRGSFNGANDGTVFARTRSVDGTWGTAINVSGTDTARVHIDQSTSLLITVDNRYHLTYISRATDDIRYAYSDNAGLTWAHNNPAGGAQASHNPSLGPNGRGGIRIYGHGTPNPSPDGHGDHLYFFESDGGGANWSPWTLYATGAFDSSINTRWAQFFVVSPQRLDVAYWSDPYPNLLYVGSTVAR